MNKKNAREQEDRNKDIRRDLTQPYGLASPASQQRRVEPAIQEPRQALRCPSCGRKIPAIWKWWDTLKAWYTESYRLIECRRCGTRFAARRKVTGNK